MLLKFVKKHINIRFLQSSTLYNHVNHFFYYRYITSTLLHLHFSLMVHSKTNNPHLLQEQYVKVELEISEISTIDMLENNIIFVIDQLKAQKAQQISKLANANTLSLNFYYLKIIYILHLHQHPKILRHILKNMQKNKYDCILEIIKLIITKMKIKMKNRSRSIHPGLDQVRNRPRSICVHTNWVNMKTVSV